jgi:hypothetical protein
MLMGSGEPEEDEQALWLEQVMTEAGERRIAWFLHRPLFLEDPEPTPRSAHRPGAIAPDSPRPADPS